MLDRAAINSNNFCSFHVLVAAQPSSLRIWWEPNISLTKVRMNVVCLKHRESLHWYLTFYFWAETWGSIFIVIVKSGIFLSGACHAYIITPFMSFFFFFNLRIIIADALESLRKSCESVCPNDGFLDQVTQRTSNAKSLYKMALHLPILSYYNLILIFFFSFLSGCS